MTEVWERDRSKIEVSKKVEKLEERIENKYNHKIDSFRMKV